MKRDIERYIKQFGSVDKLKKEICRILEEDTKDGYAEGAINQIVYWSKMLLKLKDEY